MTNAPPEKINCFGKTIHVLEDDTLEDMGEFEALTFEISYAPNQNDDALRDTIWHELFHALEDLAGDSIPEKTLRRLATNSLGLLRTNPALRRYLLDDLKEP